jgi:2-amino-4-deoxychorismate dehydrogenase
MTHLHTTPAETLNTVPAGTERMSEVLRGRRRPLVIAINGSERPEGNNTIALRHAQSVFAERGVDLEVIRLWDLDMTPCGPCGDCNFRTHPCEVRDDVAGVVDRMAEADGIIYATSVHGFGSSPKMPTFIERSGTGYLRFNRRLTNKVAGIIVIGRRYSHTETYAHLLHNVLLNRMLVAGYGFPAVLYGNEAGSILADEEGMEMLNRMIERMVDLMTVIREHKEITGRDKLAVEVGSERDRASVAAAD